MFPRAGSADRCECRIPVHMTASRTVLQFRHRVIDRRRIHFLMSSRLEISRMTARTIRLVPGKSPRNDFIIGRMAGRTGDAGSMRLVRNTFMGIRCDRYPGDTSPMTGIAGLRGDEMRRGFPCGNRPVMAGGTGARNNSGMAERCRDPCRRPVADIA